MDGIRISCHFSCQRISPPFPATSCQGKELVTDVVKDVRDRSFLSNYRFHCLPVLIFYSLLVTTGGQEGTSLMFAP